MQTSYQAATQILSTAQVQSLTDFAGDQLAKLKVLLPQEWELINAKQAGYDITLPDALPILHTLETLIGLPQSRRNLASFLTTAHNFSQLLLKEQKIEEKASEVVKADDIETDAVRNEKASRAKLSDYKLNYYRQIWQLVEPLVKQLSSEVSLQP